MSNKKLIAIFSGVFIAFCLLAIILSNTPYSGETVQITVDGIIYRKVDLSRDESFLIKTENGTNTISVKDGKIYMESADCPDKLCVRHGPLNNKYDSIVCLPNRVVIEYIEDSDIDAVAGR